MGSESLSPARQEKIPRPIMERIGRGDEVSCRKTRGHYVILFIAALAVFWCVFVLRRRAPRLVRAGLRQSGIELQPLRALWSRTGAIGQIRLSTLLVACGPSSGRSGA
jgi:H+/Cl- antiporter ClcA